MDLQTSYIHNLESANEDCKQNFKFLRKKMEENDSENSNLPLNPLLKGRNKSFSRVTLFNNHTGKEIITMEKRAEKLITEIDETIRIQKHKHIDNFDHSPLKRTKDFLYDFLSYDSDYSEIKNKLTTLLSELNMEKIISNQYKKAFTDSQEKLENYKYLLHNLEDSTKVKFDEQARFWEKSVEIVKDIHKKEIQLKENEENILEMKLNDVVNTYNLTLISGL